MIERTENFRAGRMTNVMRAMSMDHGPRRLRIAVVESGRVIDEQLVPEGEHVTVGPSERATILIPTRALPPAHQLFEHTADGYRLNVIAPIKGRMAVAGDVQLIERTDAIDLPEDARGKLVIGDTTLLFQLVAAPPSQPKPQLPISVKRSFASEVDWFTTVVASFSFLLHFFAVAAVYSDWLDPVMNDEYAVARLVETTRNLPPPPLEQKATAPDETGATAKPKAPKAPTAKGPGNKRAPGSGKPGTAPGTSTPKGDADSRAADLARELDSIGLQTVAAMQTGGPAVANVLDGSDVPFGELERAGRENIAAHTDPGGLNIGRNGTPHDLRPGGGSTDLSRIGNERTADGDSADETKTLTREVKVPVGTVQSNGGASDPQNVPGVGQTVGRMRGRFRACYQRGLNNVDPTMQGSVVLVAKVGAAGEVISVSGGGGGLAPIVPCLKSVVKSAQFQAPKNGAGIVSMNIIFKHH